MNSRSALKTTTLPTGGGPDGLSPVLVRKGEAVGYCVYAMHRRKDIYGDDAESFRPSRWDPDNKEGPDLKGVGWGYLPFNGGPRVCPGRKYSIHRDLGHLFSYVQRTLRCWKLRTRLFGCCKAFGILKRRNHRRRRKGRL